MDEESATTVALPFLLRGRWSNTAIVLPRVYNREGGRVSYFTMGLCYNTLWGS